MVDTGQLIEIGLVGATAAGAVVTLWPYYHKRREETLLRFKQRNQAAAANDANRNLLIAPSLTFLRTGRFYTETTRPAAPAPGGRIVVNLREARILPRQVSTVISAHEGAWKKSDLWDALDIAGVVDIGFPGSLDREEHADLRIDVSPQRYFEFLATNANLGSSMRSDLAPAEKEWLTRQVESRSPDDPPPTLVNPLGIHVLLLIDGGRRMVLQRRSRKAAFRGGLLFPSVGEAVSVTLDEVPGDRRAIDVGKTVLRGLKEELGVDSGDVDETYFTSLVFDREVWKYDLTALAVTSLDESSLTAFHKTGVARDRFEGELEFFNFPQSFSLAELKSGWAPEALGAYQMAIYDRLSPQHFSRLVLPATG
jgi:hypothetical protein